MKDDFKDIICFNEESLKEVWDNKKDEIWDSYLKEKIKSEIFKVF